MREKERESGVERAKKKKGSIKKGKLKILNTNTTLIYYYYIKIVSYTRIIMKKSGML